MHMSNAPGAPTAAPFSPGSPDPGIGPGHAPSHPIETLRGAQNAMADDSGAEAVPEDVPPPPVAGPGERRARVQLPEHEHDDGPTYYRLGTRT